MAKFNISITKKSATTAEAPAKKKPATTRLKKAPEVTPKVAPKVAPKVVQEVAKEPEKPRRKSLLLPSAEEQAAKAAEAPPPPVVEEVATPAPEPATEAPKPAAVAPKPAESKAAEKEVVPPKKIETFAPRKDLKAKKPKEEARFDARDRQGLRDIENEAWRKKRQFKPAKRVVVQEEIIRPKQLSVRIPITVKDLAAAMKIKAPQLIATLFAQGSVHTLNSYLDETEAELVGHEFGCTITIDRSDEERIRITDLTIRQEIEKTTTENLILRAPVVTFMGHVDHGKTSLIDAIRKSNRAASEAGAITQHIGAFRVQTAAGAVTILDTPGHEAFSEMRTRGATVTDIVVLVVAGDEGIRAQTEESIRQAREAGVSILVALNKCDKPNFDAENVFRQLADRDLLPESWGGTTITVNCSASTGQGIKELLEMIALQAEVLELKANPTSRARGTVLESEMQKGLGPVATILVQNGTLKKNDAIVFGSEYGKVKTIHDEFGKSIETAGPGVPVKITGLSGQAKAGIEFIVVENERTAKELAEERAEGELRHAQAQMKLTSLEKMMARKSTTEIKILPVMLRADTQGSLEALTKQLKEIQSKKVRLEIIDSDVREMITETDIDHASIARSIIIAFNTRVQPNAADLNKEKRVEIITSKILYELIDPVKKAMKALLDPIVEEKDTGLAEVKQVFSSSKFGLIAGCIVKDGLIKRQHLLRQLRDGKVIATGKISSLKRGKEDVKEVKEGIECGILSDSLTDLKEGDLLQAYEIQHIEQEL
jgi:translation initiation factor IF-2